MKKEIPIVGFYAVHKETGEFFVGKKTQIAYTKINYLKSAITYANGKKDKDNYDFYKLHADGTTEKLEG